MCATVLWEGSVVVTSQQGETSEKRRGTRNEKRDEKNTTCTQEQQDKQKHER